MATFPAKTNYAAGNVLTAAQMVDIGNGLNDLLPDAKGSLTTVSAANTPAQLTVGNNGETLVADSSASTGLRWQEPKAGNPVINSAFQIWQRGISITNGSSIYSADRWQAYGSGNGTVSRQATGDSTNLPNIQYCARVQRTASSSDTNPLYLAQNFETVNSIPYAGKTVTLSFYARKGANYSPTSSLLNISLQTGTGTDQAFTGYTGVAYPINSTVTLTSTWQRFSLTGTLSASLTELAIVYVANVTGTAGAADYFEITGVQLEVGSVATPFKTQGVTLAGELAACQRYYYRSTDGTTADVLLNSGMATSTTQIVCSVAFPTFMRTKPSVLESINVRLYDNVNVFTPTAAVLAGSTSFIGQVEYTVTGATAFRPYKVIGNSGSSYIGFSAEL